MSWFEKKVADLPEPEILHVYEATRSVLNTYSLGYTDQHLAYYKTAEDAFSRGGKGIRVNQVTVIKVGGKLYRFNPQASNPVVIE